MNYPVKTVHVRVGDVVSEGDLLAELDMTSLEADINQRQASLSTQQSSANQNLAVARSDLETYQRNLANGTDSNLVNARSNVVTAELDVQNAELDVQSSSNSLWSARQDLREYRDGDYYDGDSSDPEYRRLRDNIRNAETNLEKAQTNLERAKANLIKAQESYEIAIISCDDNIATYENKVRSAQISNNFNDQHINIERLQGDLEKGEIISPASGTITEVRAVSGGSGSGLLFVIQDTDSLMVITNVKEYDIAGVSIGDRVSIRADATGSEVFDGKLSRIAPTSTLTRSGSIQNSTTSEFECEVTVTSTNPGLKIGMNTRLSIVTEQNNNVYTVPHEAISADGGVYAAIAQEDGGYIVEEIPVSVGMETDLRVEIIAGSLTDGMFIIRNAEGIQAGMLVAPQS
jgi:RND family efflux transporter MFP subunit